MVIHRIDKTLIINDDVGVLSAVKIQTLDDSWLQKYNNKKVVNSILDQECLSQERDVS
jgi:hypothetical protein